MRASAPVRSCGSGSRFNGGGLTTAYPFVRAGLLTTCRAVWGDRLSGHSESSRCALGIMGLASDGTRSRRWSVRPLGSNYWAMRGTEDAEYPSELLPAGSGSYGVPQGVDVGRNLAMSRQLRSVPPAGCWPLATAWT